MFDELYKLYVDGDLAPPSPSITACLESMLVEYPDLDDVEDPDSSPWSAGPRGEASGPLLYFGVVHSSADEMRDFVAAKARGHGLVCFDPQTQEVLA
jgi:hypothetical protein